MAHLVNFDNRFEVVCFAEDDNDARLQADAIWRGNDRQNDAIEEAGGLDEYKAELEACGLFKVTQIDRAMVLQYVDWTATKTFASTCNPGGGKQTPPISL